MAVALKGGFARFSLMQRRPIVQLRLGHFITSVWLLSVPLSSTSQLMKEREEKSALET